MSTNFNQKPCTKIISNIKSKLDNYKLIKPLEYNNNILSYKIINYYEISMESINIYFKYDSTIEINTALVVNTDHKVFILDIECSHNNIPVKNKKQVLNHQVLNHEAGLLISYKTHVHDNKIKIPKSTRDNMLNSYNSNQIIKYVFNMFIDIRYNE